MPHHPVLPDRPSISRESRESRESRPLRATPMVWSTWCLLNYGRKAGRPSWNIGHKTIISHVASFRDLFKVRSAICYNAYRLRRLGKLPELSFLVFLTLKDISGKGCQFAAVVIVCFPADQSKMMETHRETSYKLMQREALHIDVLFSCGITVLMFCSLDILILKHNFPFLLFIALYPTCVPADINEHFSAQQLKL